MRCTQFLRQTLERYKRDGIEPYDPDYVWEDAHTPTPQSLGGIETVPLIREDHYVHDLYQAEDYQKYTFFGSFVKKWLYGDGFLCENWFELTGICKKWMEANSRNNAISCREAGTGIFSPEIQSKLSENGRKGGIAIRDAKKGICSPEYQKRSKERAIAAAKTNTGMHSPLAKAKKVMKTAKMVELIAPNKEVYVFESAGYAAKILNLNPGILKLVCRGGRHHHKGFTARYLEPDRY
jgi:hypothetical protein